jgi:uncharacterized protein (UPF0261 family)
MPVVLVATLDTKGRELEFVREQIAKAGLGALVIDAGALGSPQTAADTGREEVFERAGTSLAEVRSRGDRGNAVAHAAKGVAAIVEEMARAGSIDGILSIGGSAGTVIGTTAMRVLPFGIPKVMVSTLASGQTRPYIGGSDITMINPVADIAGLNRLTRTALANAAGALIGMVQSRRAEAKEPEDSKSPERPVVTATMFGLTTPCVDHARRVLEAAGCEVLVFHATGVGGQAMEGLIRDGLVDAVLDITTTELADELVGGVLSAGPDRLEAAGRRGVPQVVSVGAIDMVNFGPMETVPERFRNRKLHVHNPSITLMRTTPAENAALGARIAETLARARGPTVVLLPRGGVSGIDVPGQPFHDPEADSALCRAICDKLAGHPNVKVVVREEHINDPAFAQSAADHLLALLQPKMSR